MFSTFKFISKYLVDQKDTNNIKLRLEPRDKYWAIKKESTRVFSLGVINIIFDNTNYHF